MAVRHDFEPKILGFLCNWCCYAGADLAGVSRYQYPTNIKIIRLMCSGRVDPSFVLRALSNGTDGVFIGGCWLGECHYVTEGNYDALSMMHLTRKLLREIGLNPERLRLEWVSASQGIRFAEVVTNFTSKLKEIGPIGSEEGLSPEVLKNNFEAAKRLIPYIKLVERERIRVRFETQEEYDKYFSGDEVEGLFRDLIVDKLTAVRILSLLKNKGHSMGEISSILGIKAGEVSRHLNSSLSQGLVRFDARGKHFTSV